MSVTRTIAQFVRETSAPALPAEVVERARVHILDGFAVILSGATEKGSRILHAHLRRLGGRPEATVLGVGFRAPAQWAALANGTSGHGMDYDDTQLTTSKESVYGLLTHPTVPVLAAALAAAEVTKARGRDLLLAYVLGVEVACRVADAINPRHYQAGFHSTATMGGLGAAMAAGKLLRLNEDGLLRALGLAASMGAGLRENFGTMVKPFHAGRAAEAGLLAATLAGAGFTAARNILEAKRGFFNAAGGGYDESKILGRLGNPYFFLDPGISIKPYPSGSLSHPAQDLILELVKHHDLEADQIAAIEVGTNTNVLNALIHNEPRTALEGKFSIPFCMAIGVLERKAGIAQFVDRKVRHPKTVALMKRVRLVVDPELERLGYDLVRTRIKVRLTDGRVLERRANVAQGTPPKVFSFEDLGEKFREAAGLVLPKPGVERALGLIRDLTTLNDMAPLLRATAGRRR
jgi:2-methylcitrate dehydratase PrpD